MDTDELCALCVMAVMSPACIVVADGKRATGPQSYGFPMVKWLRTQWEPGSPLEINKNSAVGFFGVTVVRGTLVCLGHIAEAWQHAPSRW